MQFGEFTNYTTLPTIAPLLGVYATHPSGGWQVTVICFISPAAGAWMPPMFKTFMQICGRRLVLGASIRIIGCEGKRGHVTIDRGSEAADGISGAGNFCGTD